MRLYYIEVLVVLCLSVALDSPLASTHEISERDSGRLTTKPRRTLSYTISFKREEPTLEDTIHQESNDALTKYEEAIIHKPAPDALAANDGRKKVEQISPSPHNHYKKRKKKNYLEESSIDDSKKGCKSSSTKGPRHLQGTSVQSDRLSILEALYDLQSSSNTDDILMTLNLESGSQTMNEQEALELLLISLARRSGSDSRSRSDSRRKGKGKSKRRSGGKGKGKSKSSKSRKRSSRSRPRKKGKKRSQSFDSRSAASKDTEPVQDAGNVFSDEFIDFLNNYYSTGTIESDSEDPISGDFADSNDPLQDFLDRYYKMQEGSNDAVFEDDQQSPKIVETKAPSPTPIGDYYRDPNGFFDFNTPASAPTPAPQIEPNNGQGTLNDDIYNDDIAMIYPKNPSIASSPPTILKQKISEVEGKDPKAKAPLQSKSKKINKAPSISKAKKEGDNGVAVAKGEIPAPSPQRIPTTRLDIFDDDDAFRSPAQSKNKKIKTSPQSNAKKEGDPNSNSTAPKDEIPVPSFDIFDDDEFKESLQIALKNKNSSQSRSGPSASVKKQKKEKTSKKRMRRRKYI